MGGQSGFGQTIGDVARVPGNLLGGSLDAATGGQFSSRRIKRRQSKEADRVAGLLPSVSAETSAMTTRGPLSMLVPEFAPNGRELQGPAGAFREETGPFRETPAGSTPMDVLAGDGRATTPMQQALTGPKRTGAGHGSAWGLQNMDSEIVQEAAQKAGITSEAYDRWRQLHGDAGALKMLDAQVRDVLDPLPARQMTTPGKDDLYEAPDGSIVDLRTMGRVFGAPENTADPHYYSSPQLLTGPDGTSIMAATAQEAQAFARRGFTPADDNLLSPDALQQRIQLETAGAPRTEGAIPADHRAVRDASGNVVNYEVIEGSPTDVQNRRRDASREAGTAGKGLKYSVVQDAVDQVRNSVTEHGSMVTGLGSMTAGIPGTPAADMAANINTLKAFSTTENLQAMRAASPTGGALGAVSDREGDWLASMFGSLEQSQSPEQFERNLNNYEWALGVVANIGLDNITPEALERFGMQAPGHMSGTDYDAAPIGTAPNFTNLSDNDFAAEGARLFGG